MIIDFWLLNDIQEKTGKEYDVVFMDTERTKVLVKNEVEIIEDLLEVIENGNK